MNRDDIQTLVVNYLNDKMDIPKITEDEEEKLLDTIYDAAIEASLLAIDRI